MENQNEKTPLRLKRAKEKNEILEKAAVFFAKELDCNTSLFDNIAKNTKWPGYVKLWKYRPVVLRRHTV